LSNRPCDRERRDGRKCSRIHFGQVKNGTLASEVRRQAMGILTIAEVRDLMPLVCKDRFFVDDLQTSDKK
jgi:hypothetical protein